MVAKRLALIGESETLAISAKAKAMKAAGIAVVDFSLGEPDLPTPDPIKAAGKRAIEENFTRYTQAPGIPELKQAIVDKLARDNGVVYQTDEVIVSAGAKHSLFNACMALVDPGDEVIVPAPYWLSYPALVHLVGGVPRIVQTAEADDFLLTPAALEAAIGPATRALLLNNPSNPTGMAYSRERLAALAEIAVARGLWIIADEIYEKMLYDAAFVCTAALGEAVRQRTLTVNGVSKSYCMTGWRIGYTAGPRDVIAAMTKVQSQTTSSICSIAQKAAVEALAGDQGAVARMVEVFRERRDRVVARLQAMPGVRCRKPAGAFYVFPNVTAFYERLPAAAEKTHPSVRLADYLLEEAHAAVVPGIAFGAGDHIRLSYATGLEELDRGLHRIDKALARL
ncbi:MAG: pyridoxal phosphate-dependent aminotransferase [Planctomycetes bacterium]|nr:pyridoxal phosphate-dependent aminotransferase [Planctomycetota bacterium]